MRIFRNPIVLIGVLVAAFVALWICDAKRNTSPAIVLEPQFAATEGAAAWWCLEDEPCWHDRGACDAVRRREFESGRRVRTCVGADTVACLTTEHVLDKRRTKECFVSIAACKGRITSLHFSQPDDVKVVVECVPE
jgi:hypothetical protein